MSDLNTSDMLVRGDLIQHGEAYLLSDLNTANMLVRW